ncbi:MAG: CPBP family intramembrane metalloprotease [Spirochaetales bacterium]|nr:CPBP family intramembrane metalloprotease [Spirochaetales bacterium]
MDADSGSRSWTQPVIVSVAMLAPTLVPGFAPPSGSVFWLGSGAVQALSQFALLMVIIGASGRLRDYGVGPVRAPDLVRAVPLFALLVVAARLTIYLLAPAAGSGGFSPPQTLAASDTALVVALSIAFALATGYREELFYRLYVIGTLRERGAGQVAAILVSTGLFAAGHAYQGAIGIASAGIVGVILAGATVRGARLHTLAIAHALYDAGVLLAGFGLWPVPAS